MSLSVDSSPYLAPTPAETPRQRRETRRGPWHAEVSVMEPCAGTGVTINASPGGLRIAVDCTLKVGDVCMLVLREPNQPVRLERGRVVWIQATRDGSVAGLSLTGLH